MKLKLTKKNVRAFTLVELLVVIAIIGILSGLIVVSMNGSINLANDAKRKDNIDKIRIALVVYGTLNGMIYPIQPTQCTIGGGTTPCLTLTSNLSELLPNLPVDPVSGYYTYVSDSTGSNYVLSSVLSSSFLSYSSNGGYTAGPLDVDGNGYGTVTIGTQIWLTSNLMTTRYRDGTAITRGPTGATWDGTDHGYYAYPPNAGNTAEESLANIQANKLGFIYQWSAVANTKGICPTGWHVPSETEFKTLDEYLGTAGCETTNGWQCSPAGNKLKEAGTAHWFTGNTGTNTSGFSAVGTGYRGMDGSFPYNHSTATYFWSSTISNVTQARDRCLYYAEDRVSRYAHDQSYGYSVRCLKD